MSREMMERENQINNIKELTSEDLSFSQEEVEVAISALKYDLFQKGLNKSRAIVYPDLMSQESRSLIENQYANQKIMIEIIINKLSKGDFDLTKEEIEVLEYALKVTKFSNEAVLKRCQEYLVFKENQELSGSKSSK